MTVSATDDIKIAYAGDNGQTVFTTPQFLTNGDITAVLTVDATGAETPLVLGSDYNLTGAGDPSGTLTTTGALSPPDIGETLTIKGVPVLEQETDFVEGGAFLSAALESELDRSRLIDKSTAEDFTRTIQFPLSDTAPTAVLPPAQDRAGKLQTFDDFGSPTVTSSIDLFTETVNVNSDTTIDGDFQNKTIFVDNSSNDVTLTFADATAVTGPTGNFCAIVVTGKTFDVIVTVAVPTQLRSQNGVAEWDETEDPIYLGQSRALADESYSIVTRSTSIWRVNGQARSSSGGDEALLTRSTLLQQESEAGAHTFVQADHGKEKLFTGGSAQNWTVPVLSAGTAVVVHNIGTATITFVASGVTLTGLANLAADKSASLSWLPSNEVKLTGELS